MNDVEPDRSPQMAAGEEHPDSDHLSESEVEHIVVSSGTDAEDGVNPEDAGADVEDEPEATEDEIGQDEED